MVLSSHKHVYSQCVPLLPRTINVFMKRSWVLSYNLSFSVERPSVFRCILLLSCVTFTDKWMLKRLCGLNWADCPESFQCALGFASSFSFCCVFGLVIKDMLAPECIMERILFYPVSWVIGKFSLRQLQVYGVEWTLLAWPLLWEAFYYHWDAQSLLQNFLSFISILVWDFSIYKNSFLESHFSVSSVCWIIFLCSIYILLILELF